MRIVQHKHKEEKHEGSPPKVSEDGEEIADETKSVKEKSVNHYTLEHANPDSTQNVLLLKNPQF